MITMCGRLTDDSTEVQDVQFRQKGEKKTARSLGQSECGQSVGHAEGLSPSEGEDARGPWKDVLTLLSLTQV